MQSICQAWCTIAIPLGAVLPVMLRPWEKFRASSIKSFLSSLLPHFSFWCLTSRENCLKMEACRSCQLSFVFGTVFAWQFFNMLWKINGSINCISVSIMNPSDLLCINENANWYFQAAIQSHIKIIYLEITLPQDLSECWWQIFRAYPSHRKFPISREQLNTFTVNKTSADE